MEWKWDRDGSWLCGTEEDGCGVFTRTRGWYGVVLKDGKYVGPELGPFNDLGDAQDECERVLREAANG